MDLAAHGDFLGDLANDPGLRELHASIVASLGEEMSGKRVLVITDDSTEIAPELAERGVYVTAMARDRTCGESVTPFVFAGFQAEYFDAVLFSSVLEHVPIMECVARESARVLRSGGRFLSIGVAWETLAFGGIETVVAEALRKHFAGSQRARASNMTLPILLRRAGFTDFTVTGKELVKRALGSATLYATVTAFAISAYKF